MKAIIVEQEIFDKEFKSTLDTLKLTRFVENGILRPDAQFENSPIGNLHRAFVYEIFQLKNRLEKAR